VRAVVLLLVAALAGRAAAASVDSDLLEDIEAVRMVDDQIHPRVASPSAQDTEWHPLYPHGTLVESLHAPLPARLRPGTPELARAWRALYGYRHDDLTPAHVREGLDAKRVAQATQGEAYPSWILEKLGIDMALANRARLGPGIAAPRFRWVAFADPLLFPLGTGPAEAENPERRVYFDAIRRGRGAFAGASPSTLPEYLEEVVTPTLLRMQQEGAVAIKLEGVGLQRPAAMAVDEFEARAIYARHAFSKEPPRREYEELRSFLVRYVAQEASRLGLVVHIHTGSDLGAGFGLRGARPSDLGWLVDDAVVDWTNFVLVQGGWPFTAEVAAMLAKPNIYADISAQSYGLSPPLLAASLRPWLELYPEKVLFGTGALPLSSELGWEELAWLAVTNARQALAMALGGMIEDGVVSRARAREIARLVLRDNAVALYKLSPR
jgi:predicted TIM-barrel fold metal-dependent hydrolase